MSGALAWDARARPVAVSPIYSENLIRIAQETIMGGKGLYSVFSL
jgi:hypothetical protein